MPFEGPDITEAEPASPDFCADDADVVIRVAGTRSFRVHKPILSLVSPVFKDMFTIPQPPAGTPGTLPHVDVDESAEAWENILRTIYPMPTPIVHNINDLESLLFAAKKYEMQFVIDSHIRAFESRDFIQQDPLHLYAIACACGLEGQAKYVARNAEFPKITGRSDAGDLRGLTVGSYHNLVSFLAQRDSEWNQALHETQTPGGCRCNQPWKDFLYHKIKQNLKTTHLQTGEIYLKALEDRAQSRQPGCAADNCSVLGSEIKEFIERVVKRREDLYDKLMCEKRYVQ